MNIWNFIYDSITQHKPIVLMLVVHSKGSSPGRVGFKMAINTNAKMFGSIGGGAMEFNIIEECKSLIKKPFLPFLKHQVHRKQSPVNASGLNCSGEQTIIFYYLDFTQIETIEKLVKLKLSTLLADNNGITATSDIKTDQFSFKQMEGAWMFAENLVYVKQLFIIGGGHVSVAFSKIMFELGFQVTIIDNRKGLNTLVSNKYVHEKIVSDYHDIGKFIPDGDNVYITVMSIGYTTDEVALKQLIKKKVKYLGSMGSKAKIRKLKNNLKRQGFSALEVDRIYAPIGLDIFSRTPMEIAISIAAEIIKVKNSMT